MKKLLILLLILTLTIGTLFGCDLIKGEDPPDGPDTEQGTDTPGTDDPGTDENEPKRLGTPIVRISGRGIASWNAIPGATGYKIIIGSEEYVRTITSIQLKDGDVITVQALGDGVTTLDSEFSKLMMYDLPDAPTVTTIEALASAPFDKAYSVKGLVCAAGEANLLLTDNKGNYVYVYTLDPHGYSVGDEVEFTGTKAAYWNVYELKDITSSTLISSGNEIETPFVKQGTADYFEGKLESFTVGELVTVSGRLSISGNYYNFEVEGLDGALLSLAYNGTLEDGKDYTATGYLAFISGSTAKYINIIVTDIKEVNDDEPPEVCPNCGVSVLIGDHSKLACGHYACDGGEHTQLTCGHYACDGMEHHILDCGHRICDGGEHTVLGCGHFACEDGEHVLCERCETYRCQGDHTECDTPSEYCEICGGSIYVGDHYELDCGHCASLDGEHSLCSYCGNYLCTGDHSLCGGTEIIYCDACHGSIYEGDHTLQNCGHYICVDGEHGMYGCGHYTCEDGDHTLLDCGHHVCQGGDHSPCEYCGIFACVTDHSSCGTDDTEYCQWCGEDVGEGVHFLQGCGHYTCVDGMHDQLTCGHYSCESGEHFLCSYCSGYLCTGDHSLLECGHFACQDGNHIKLTCGHYECEGGDHTLYGCGHYECQDGEHERCIHCGKYLCTGDHLSCGKPTVEYCKSCGKDVSTGDHSLLDCGHYACDGIDHSLCEICEEPLCIGEHGDGVCMKLSTFPEVIEGEYGEVHIVEGIICAVSADEILITDNEGNYLYVYTEQPHGYTVGDGVRATGHLETYGNLTYELVATDIVCTSGGNDIVLPRLNSTDSSYFLDAATSGYKMGEYITFEGYLDSSTDFFVVGDIYVGVRWTDIEIYYGKTYQVVAYTLFISENGAWVIATDFHGESDSLICPICGFYKFEGDHSMYICGHFACEGGDHAPLPCGHFECDEGDHTLQNCGHYICTDGEHGKLDCGHFECDTGDHDLSGCGHYVCLYGKHYLLDCGHWSCEGGTHSHCGYCGGYLCMGDHSECKEDEELYCEICGGILTEGDHYLLVCGHYVCDGRDHDKLPCEHYICDGEDHSELPCGHYACEEGSHVKLACGHFACQGGNHGKLPCGHFVCQGGSHTKCAYCGGYLCIGTHDHEEYCSYCGGSLEYGDHSLLDCGHRACQDGDHETCSYCGKYYCQGGVHSICYGCRGAVCDGKDHGMCPTCGWYLCRGDHSMLECGHKACESGSHYPCDVCGEYLCLGGEHSLLDCGHYICDGGIHKSCTACGEYTCNAPDHMLCILCNEPECVGIHKTCPGCGEVTCNRADHSMCTVCGNRLCVGDHTECVVEGYFCDFNYSIHVGFSVDNYFLENDEISRPLIRLISNGYSFEQSLTLKFVPSDGGRFVLTAGYDFLGLAWIDEYTFSGTFENVGLLYRINITEASRYNASTGETEDMMQYKGTYFPFTTEDYIMVNDETHTFEIDKYGLLYFIFSEQYDYPPYEDICAFCDQEVTADNIPIHIYVCDVCGKHYCEGGVTEHLFYNDETWKSEHYPVTDEEKRWGVKLPGDVVINPIVTADLPSESTSSETSSNDEEEE